MWRENKITTEADMQDAIAVVKLCLTEATQIVPTPNSVSWKDARELFELVNFFSYEREYLFKEAGKVLGDKSALNELKNLLLYIKAFPSGYKAEAMLYYYNVFRTTMEKKKEVATDKTVMLKTDDISAENDIETEKDILSEFKDFLIYAIQFVPGGIPSAIVFSDFKDPQNLLQKFVSYQLNTEQILFFKRLGKNHDTLEVIEHKIVITKLITDKKLELVNDKLDASQSKKMRFLNNSSVALLEIQKALEIIKGCPTYARGVLSEKLFNSEGNQSKLMIELISSLPSLKQAALSNHQTNALMLLLPEKDDTELKIKVADLADAVAVIKNLGLTAEDFIKKYLAAKSPVSISHIKEVLGNIQKCPENARDLLLKKLITLYTTPNEFALFREFITGIKDFDFETPWEDMYAECQNNPTEFNRSYLRGLRLIKKLSISDSSKNELKKITGSQEGYAFIEMLSKDKDTFTNQEIEFLLKQLQPNMNPAGWVDIVKVVREMKTIPNEQWLKIADHNVVFKASRWDYILNILKNLNAFPDPARQIIQDLWLKDPRKINSKIENFMNQVGNPANGTTISKSLNSIQGLNATIETKEKLIIKFANGMNENILDKYYKLFEQLQKSNLNPEQLKEVAEWNIDDTSIKEIDDFITAINGKSLNYPLKKLFEVFKSQQHPKMIEVMDVINSRDMDLKLKLFLQEQYFATTKDKDNKFLKCLKMMRDAEISNQQFETLCVAVFNGEITTATLPDALLVLKSAKTIAANEDIETYFADNATKNNSRKSILQYLVHDVLGLEPHLEMHFLEKYIELVEKSCEAIQVTEFDSFNADNRVDMVSRHYKDIVQRTEEMIDIAAHPFNADPQPDGNFRGKHAHVAQLKHLKDNRHGIFAVKDNQSATVATKTKHLKFAENLENNYRGWLNWFTTSSERDDQAHNLIKAFKKINKASYTPEKYYTKLLDVILDTKKDILNDDKNKETPKEFFKNLKNTKGYSRLYDLCSQAFIMIAKDAFAEKNMDISFLEGYLREELIVNLTALNARYFEEGPPSLLRMALDKWNTSHVETKNVLAALDTAQNIPDNLRYLVDNIKNLRDFGSVTSLKTIKID